MAIDSTESHVQSSHDAVTDVDLGDSIRSIPGQTVRQLQMATSKPLNPDAKPEDWEFPPLSDEYVMSLKIDGQEKLVEHPVNHLEVAPTERKGKFHAIDKRTGIALGVVGAGAIIVAGAAARKMRRK